MRLDEFRALVECLHQLQDTFPADKAWGELEQAVVDHMRDAGQQRPELVTVPTSREQWEKWCEKHQRHLLNGENVEGTIFFPKPILLDASSTVDGSVYCTAEISAATRTLISGDLVSRKHILWRGEMVRSLVAPEIHINQLVHKLDITGSIVCRRLKTTPQGYLTGKIAGSLFVSEAIADGTSGKTSTQLTIAGGSEMGGIHVPCAVACGDHSTVRHIQATGDVKLGSDSKAGVVKGRDVVIGARSQVYQIYAEGVIDIAEGGCIHDAVAAGDIKVGQGVEVSSGIVASLDGEIIADSAWWKAQQPFHYKCTGNLSALLNRVTTAGGGNGADRSIILRILPHAWYWSLKQMDPHWFSELVPVDDKGDRL